MVLVCCECTCILWRNCVAVRNGGHHGGGIREKKWTRFGLSVVRLSRAKLANLRMSTSVSPKMGPTQFLPLPTICSISQIILPPGGKVKLSLAVKSNNGRTYFFLRTRIFLSSKPKNPHLLLSRQNPLGITKPRGVSP
jgi:hypothetical protein